MRHSMTGRDQSQIDNSAYSWRFCPPLEGALVHGRGARAPDRRTKDVCRFSGGRVGVCSHDEWRSRWRRDWR